MQYERKFLSPESEIILGHTSYRIDSVLGRGSSAIVYAASYPDQMNPDYFHKVLIREFFPLDKDGLIYRDENGFICCDETRRDFMEMQKRYFYRGNRVNLELMKEHPHNVSYNMNTYEAYGSYYTIMSMHGGSVLEDILTGKDGQKLSLKQMVLIIRKVLLALKPFHDMNLLHIDISPDNILIFDDCAVLIDYNSSFNLGESADDFDFFVKEGYAAPEILLGNYDKIGFCTDLFSVCAVFFRMLTGRSLDGKDYSSRKRLQAVRENPLISSQESASAAYLLSFIFVKGLHTLPKKRYQTTDEMLSDLDELLARLEGRGVSRSSLWENSRARLKRYYFDEGVFLTGNEISDEEKILPLEIAYEDKDRLFFDKPSSPLNVSEEKLYALLCRKCCICLLAPDGMGKTSLLGRFWLRATEEYSEKQPVFYYLSGKNLLFDTRSLENSLAASDKKLAAEFRKNSAAESTENPDTRSGKILNSEFLNDSDIKAGDNYATKSTENPAVKSGGNSELSIRKTILWNMALEKKASFKLEDILELDKLFSKAPDHSGRVEFVLMIDDLPADKKACRELFKELEGLSYMDNISIVLSMNDTKVAADLPDQFRRLYLRGLEKESVLAAVQKITEKSITEAFGKPETSGEPELSGTPELSEKKALYGNLPDGVLSDNMPDGALSDNMPDGALSDNMPDGALSDNMPDGVLPDSMSDGVLSDDMLEFLRYPAAFSLFRKRGERDIEAHLDDILIRAQQSCGGDKGEKYKIRFVMKHFLADVAGAMTKEGPKNQAGAMTEEGPKNQAGAMTEEGPKNQAGAMTEESPKEQDGSTSKETAEDHSLNRTGEDGEAQAVIYKISSDELLRLSGLLYRKLFSKNFETAYPDFKGMEAAMLESFSQSQTGQRIEDEQTIQSGHGDPYLHSDWLCFEYVVNDILVGKLGLLKKIDEGSYSFTYKIVETYYLEEAGKQPVESLFADALVTDSEKERIRRKKRKKYLTVASVFLVSSALICGLLAKTKPWVVTAQTLGNTNSNIYNLGRYILCPEQYEYYVDVDGNLKICSYDKEEEAFLINKSQICFEVESDEDCVNFLNRAENKIYFVHTDMQSGADQIMSMDLDGQNQEIVYTLENGQNGDFYNYAKLSDGSEYIYYLLGKSDDDGGFEATDICRYNLSSKENEAIISGNVQWFNLTEDALYYIDYYEVAASEEEKNATDYEPEYNTVFHKTNFKGGQDEIIDDDSGFVLGFIEGDTAFLIVLNENAGLVTYDLNENTGSKSEKNTDYPGIFTVDPENAQFAYWDGWVYYSYFDSQEVRRIRSDGTNDELVFEGIGADSINCQEHDLFLFDIPEEYETQEGSIYNVDTDGDYILEVEPEAKVIK